MLEIQPFDAWAEANATADPSDKIKQYADYVRTSAYKNGQLDDTAEQEIQQGIVDRARVDGLISDEEPEEDRNQKLQGLLTPIQNKDADARFLLDHYQNDFGADSPEALEKAPTIQKYLSLKQVSPNQIGELQGLVDGYVSDKVQVKNARLSAVDRGDYRVVAIDEDGGRQLYTGADTKPDNLNGELDTLIGNGAISASDLSSVKKLTMPINGGQATVAEGTRYNVFANSIQNLAKKDPTLRSSIDQEAARIREAKRTEQLTVGETVFDYVKKAVALPLDAIGDVVTEAFGLAHREEAVAPPLELIGGNKAITGRFSASEVNQFLGDYMKHASGPYYRADRPETGIDTDSLGNVIVSPALIGNKTQFEQALKMAPLNDDQKERATIQRQAMLETEAPKILKLILGESSEAASAYAVARASGKKPSEFIEEWVGNNSQNYDGMSERLQQLGMSTFSAIATLPVGIGALMGIEPAAKALVAMNKEQSDREEYARLFGDEFGFTFQLVNTIPQVATDILATIGTQGLYTGIKGIAKGSSKAIVREATRGAMSMVDDTTAAVVKNAATTGGEALVGEALEKVGGSLATNLAKADRLVPLFATSFTRSASSTYGSIYGQLPDGMSADEKHRNAFGYAIASGLSTAIITSGMSFLGEGGIEDLATGKFRPITAADDTATNVRKVSLGELNYKQAKFLNENLNNAGAKLTDKAFKDALTANIGSAYKSYIRTTLRGGINEGFEEALDQAIQSRIEDASLDKNTPLSERVNQIWSAFALGGIMGGVAPAIGQIVKPLDQSEMSMALDARASVLSKVANDLRKTGSTATAEVLQRQLNDAQAAANAQRQTEIAAQQQKEVKAKTTEVVTQADKPYIPEAVIATPTAVPATFEPSGQGELALGDTRAMVLPEKTRFLTDFDGERAYLGSYAGTLEVDGSVVRLNLDEPRADGVTHLDVGNRFQPVDRSGVRLDRKRLMLTGEHDGTIVAGTPYVIPDPKTKIKFAFPLDPANVSFVQDMANAPALRIKNARVIGQENVSSPIILTDKGQIEDALRYYNLDPAVLMQPENVGQLELDLFDETPAVEAATTPVANPTAVAETSVVPQVTKKGRGRKGKGAVAEAPLTPTAPSETDPTIVVADAIETGVTPTPEVRTEEQDYVRNLIIENPLTTALLAVESNGFTPDEINSVANGFAPEVFSDLKNRIDKATEYAMGLDDSLADVRSNILSNLTNLSAIYKRVEVARFIEAKPAAVVEAAAKQSPASEQPTETNNENQTEVTTGRDAIFAPPPEGVSYTKADSGNHALVATKTDDILAELAKVQGTEAKLAWMHEHGFLTLIGGNTHVDHDMRVMVLMRVGNANVPFYISTGLAGKKNVKAGSWYAVWGIGTRGWINKGSEANINTQYGYPILQKIARILNEGIGTINPDKAPTLEDYEDINSKMNLGITPAKDHNDADTFWPNVATALGRINEETGNLAARAGKNKKPAAAPIVEEAPDTQQAAPVVTPIAETPATKKTRAKKQSVTPLPETTVVSNAENPSDDAADLQEELTNLNTTVPVFDVDGQPTTLESLEVQFQQLDNRIQAARESKTPIPSGVLDAYKSLKSTVNVARFAVEGKATEIKAQIEELTAPDPEVDIRTDAQKNAEELLSIMRGEMQVSPQVAAAAAAVKPTPSKFEEKMGVGPVGFKPEKAKAQPIAVFKDGVFRNAEEANLYTNWLAGGFAISNLAEHGFDPKKVSGIDFQSHSTEIKQRLWKDIQERFPFIPVPEGTPTTKSKRRVAYMTKAGDNYIDVPYEVDSDGKPVRGVFTNNPLITAQQIDMGLMIVIPKSVATSAGFSKNPSIDAKATGKGSFVVTGVKRHPFDTGVFNAGDISLVGKSGYTPKKAMTSLGDFLRPPASKYLDGAGPSARNKANNNFDTYMNDMMSVSNESNVVNKVTGERRSSFGSFENLISNSFGLSEDRGREAMSEAQIAYANNLKEYALAKKIQSALAKAQLKDSSATLIDLNLPKIILEETVSEDQVTPTPNEVADTIKKVYALTGGSAEGVISNYGRYLYDSITSGELSVGVKPFRTHLISATKRYQVSEIRRNSRARGNSATTQEEYELTLNSLIDPQQDVVESAIRLLDTSTLNQLANTLRTNTKAYDSLFKIVQKSFPDTSEDMDEVELIDMAGTILGNYQKEESIKLARDLQNSPEGLDLANALIDVGWLPPLNDRVVTPKQTAGTPTQLKPLPEGATLANKQQRLRLAKRVVKAAEGIHFSEADGRMLADEARKVNNAEIKRLGIVSNDPESVIAALRDLQESGTSMQRLVAGVLTANVDLIRNVRFVIGDMNDVRFAGAFMPKSNLVAINISGHNGRGIVDVLLHEYLHAVTVQTMTNPRTPAQVAALQRIASLRALTASQAAKMGLDTEGFESAFTDDLEFVTLALTAPEFQSLVRAATPTAQRSLLSRIWESLRSLFGYATTDKKMADAFDELLDFTQMFAGANTFNIKAERNLRLDAHKIEEGLGVLREYAKFRGQLRSNSNVLLTAKEQAQVVGTLTSPVASFVNSTNTRPLSMFRSQAAIEDMINGKGGVLGGLTVAADGTVPWQSLSAKITKGFSKGEASLVIPSLEGLVVNGRIDADKAITNLQALASARVSVSQIADEFNNPLLSDEKLYRIREQMDEVSALMEVYGEGSTEYDNLEDELNSLKLLGDEAFGLYNARYNKNYAASKRYKMVNPKDPNQMEDVRDILIENPTAQQLFKEGVHFPNRNNIIGFGRSYTETLPNGQKATFLFEVQSDWATKGETNVEPLLAAYETLVLKAAISDAISRGQNYVVLPDAETAMMTEGHDRGENLNEFGRPKTELGMRAAYSPRVGRLHTLMSRLTKTIGEPVDMGKMQQDPSMVFKSEGASKTNATGIAYDLSNVDGRELSMLFSVARQDAAGGVAIDTESQFKDQLPEGINLRMDSQFKGIAGISRQEPNVMRFNKEYLDGLVAGLDERAAKARIRGLANHEVAHFAALSAFTPEQIARVATELGEDQLQKIAEQYYSTAGLTAEETLANVKADRESGVLSNERIADEWIRMQVEKAVLGQTYEDVIKGTRGNQTLLDTIVEAIKAYVTRLRQRYTDYPSAETAAAISHASRTLRKINKSGSIDLDASLFDENQFGDTANFFASLDGAPVGDQVSYSIPVLSSNAGKVDAVNERVRLYNLPSQLRDIMNLRSGTINQIAASSKSLIKYFPKYRDLALKGGVSMDDIKILFGTTAPPLTDSDLKDIAKRTAAFELTIPDTETEGRKADLVTEYSEKLKRERRLKFNTAFTKLQAAAEQSITDAGFGQLVKEAVAFRKDINKFKGLTGFDESNDVYLTRAYKFFNTEGWSLAAKSGGVIKIDGKDVDFGKLRDAAAAAYYEEAEAEFQKIGKPFTDKEVTDLTLSKLDKYLATLETMTSTMDRQVVDSIRKDLNRFKPKKDIDSTFRELLGEIDDPLANAVNTLYRVGMLDANEKFRTNFAKTAQDLGLASKEAKAGWVTAFASSSAPRTGDLAGLYFDPKVAGVLNEVFGANMNGLNSNSTNLMNTVGRVAMGVSGMAIQMKTQFGIGYWPRNAIGGYVLSAAQGIFMNPLSAKGKQAMNESWRASFASLPTDQAQRESILRLVELNVLNDQSQGRVAQDLLRGLIASPQQELQELMAAVDEARATKDAGGVFARIQQSGYLKGGLDKTLSVYSTVTDKLAALDGALDGMFKANAYYYDLAVIKKHFNTMPLEQQEEAAARKVKLTFAGNSQVIDLVKSFNKTPMAALFLPFARWKSEVFRTMLNTIPLAMEEIGQGGAMTRRGVQRLAGFIGTITAAPAVLGVAATTVFRALAGDDEEEERKLTAVELAALRESLPQWQRGHQLLAQILKGGKIQFIDMSYILPHSQLTDMVAIITDGIKTGEGINVSRLASYVTGDLIGTQIAATAIDEILNNADDRGQPIYLETDNAARKMQRMLGHYAKGAVIPSSVSKGLDIAREGQTNAEEIFWGEILGSRPKTVTFGEVERRGFRNLKGLLDKSVSIIGDLTSGRFKTDDEINEVVDRHQDALNETQRRMNRFMRSMVSMGSPESSVYSSAKMYKFSDDTIGSAYQGYRIAWRPNDKWNQKTYFNAEQAKEQDPTQKLQSINKSVNRKGAVFYVNGPYDE
jgi:hypothetical protein